MPSSGARPSLADTEVRCSTFKSPTEAERERKERGEGETKGRAGASVLAWRGLLGLETLERGEGPPSHDTGSLLVGPGCMEPCRAVPSHTPGPGVQVHITQGEPQGEHTRDDGTSPHGQSPCPGLAMWLWWRRVKIYAYRLLIFHATTKTVLSTSLSLSPPLPPAFLRSVVSLFFLFPVSSYPLFSSYCLFLSL